MQENTQLKKVLTPLHLWALAVGLVISGEYFGWNLGWQTSGAVGMMIATLIVTVLYITFIFSFTELTASIPHAGGPFAYSYRALGPIGGFVAGYATLVEFLISAPAIAVALGTYMSFLYPSLDIKLTACACYIVFTGINLLGIKESAQFNLFVTLLAIIELCIFMGITGPHFKWANFSANPMPHGIEGVFHAMPFAIWLYVCIEGVAMVAEEVKNPRKNIPKGYIYGILTLAVLAIGVMLCAGGIGDWQLLSSTDKPLPDAIGLVLGKTNTLTHLFAGIGLFGLIASFHSIITGYSRQIFALGRSGYLPTSMASVNKRFQTPHWALIVGGVTGVITIYSINTDSIITLSVIGALVMYIISMVSLFILRKREPNQDRPFTVPFYPWFPAIALGLSLVGLAAIAWYYTVLTTIFFGSLVLFVLIFISTGKHKQKLDDTILQSAEPVTIATPE